MIWGALIFPIVAIILASIFFTKHMAWWEYLLLLFAPLACIAIAKEISIYSQTSDTEYWNSYAVKATYFEDWNEYIHKTCSETYSCGTDSKGNTKTCTRYYDCSYVDYHPEYWQVEDNLGNTYNVSQDMFVRMTVDWKNKTFVDMNRGFYTNDGDAYVTMFNDSLSAMYPICESHTYENKIQCSKSVFNFKEVDSNTIKQYQLFNYPSCNTFNYNPILGYDDPKASLKLQRYNALYGASKKVHMLILIFKDQPIEAAFEQMNYWKGGNKNEFILCIGLSGNNIQWTKVISWTDNEVLKIEVAQKVKTMGFDMNKIIDYMSQEVLTQFVKKSFKDFNYLSVEPTKTAVIVTYIIVFLLTVGLMIFSIANDFDFGRNSPYLRRW